MDISSAGEPDGGRGADVGFESVWAAEFSTTGAEREQNDDILTRHCGQNTLTQSNFPKLLYVSFKIPPRPMHFR